MVRINLFEQKTPAQKPETKPKKPELSGCEDELMTLFEDDFLEIGPLIPNRLKPANLSRAPINGLNVIAMW